MFGTNVQPIPLKPDDRTKADRVYDNWGQSISFFERSVNVSAFSSKFDAFLAGNYTMTPNEMAGYNLFKGKANCNSCHLDGRSTAPSPTAPGSTDTGTAASTRPLFTCFGFANLGLPLNPRDAFYYQTTPDFYGFTPNGLDTICADDRRPNADLYGARCGSDAATVSHHRGPGTLFPEGILSQWLRQEPKATGSFL